MSERDEEATGPPTPAPSKRGLRDRTAEARQRAERLKRQAAERVEQERERRSSVALAVETYERDKRLAGGLLAGGLAFRFFLWMLPFALLVVTTVSFVAQVGERDPSDVAESAGLSAAFAGTVSRAVRDSDNARIVLFLLGLYLTYAAGRSVVKALAVAHTVAWQLRERPRVRGWRGSVAFTGIALGSLALSTAARWLDHGLVTDLLVTVVLVAAFAAVAVFVSRLLPHAEGAPWTAFVPGSVVFAIGVEALRLVSALYLAPRLARTPELYGAMGLASVYLLWLYLLARCVVASAFMNATSWYRAHPEGLSGSGAALQTEPETGLSASGVEADPEAVERPQP